MNTDIIKQISEDLNIRVQQVEVTLKLLEEGNTIPFIARYRKDITGALDEEKIKAIEEVYNYQVNLLKRKEDVIRLIDEKGLLTDELKSEIMNATKLVEVEDLYRPFKEKKKTKATEAIKNGLEGLAKEIMAFPTTGSIENIAKKYLNENVETIEEAVQGAKYIIAENISDNAKFRKTIRDNTYNYGIIKSKKKKNSIDENKIYDMYYDYEEKVKYIKPHRILALNRGENEGILSVSIDYDKERVLDYLEKRLIKNDKSFVVDIVKDAIEDSYKRLIEPSIEREIRSDLTVIGEDAAISNFAKNLESLLLTPPMKERVVLGFDPGYVNGCKIAVIDKTGKYLDSTVVKPFLKGNQDKLIEQSEIIVKNLISKYNVDIIAIGNGTASRETERFIAEIIKENKLPCKYVVVSEAGASVYSASPLAMEEFPELSVEQRSAISIARRIQDPLAELVKIDPKSIGVGQYQHDVAQNKLSKSLEDVVVDAVNKVGVNLNTASPSLLSYVSGLSKGVAKNIVAYREENKGFTSRDEVKKVSKLGPKTYEQCIGFLRVLGGENPLDMTPIHPESYDKAMKLLERMGMSVDMLGTEEMKKAVEVLDRVKAQNELEIDKFTFNDILDAFVAPLRDIRESYPGLKLRDDIMHFEDIKVGDELDGIVRNVVDFGVFVDCGVKYDGLIHISKMSNNKVNHPSDILSVGDDVHVYVIEIDYQKHKLGLSLMKM